MTNFKKIEEELVEKIIDNLKKLEDKNMQVFTKWFEKQKNDLNDMIKKVVKIQKDITKQKDEIGTLLENNNKSIKNQLSKQLLAIKKSIAKVESVTINNKKFVKKYDKNKL